MTEKKLVNKPAKQLSITPITRHEIQRASTDRIALIMKEFINGFNFIKDYPKSITFFGSAKLGENSPYYQKARKLGERIVNELGYAVFTGGGPGLMEAMNRGVFEAKGQSLGLTIELPFEQSTNPYLTDYLDFYYFFSRKVCMSFSAQAYICFPGGYGTLNEFFEILTLVQTHKIEKFPIILVGSEFWNGVDEFIKKEMLTRDTIDPEDVKLYTITDNEDEIIDIIKKAPIQSNVRELE